MYWPIGTPRIYATSSGRAPELSLFVSYDGLQQPDDSSSSSSFVQRGQTGALDVLDPNDVDTLPPLTPMTPSTPAVQSIEQDDYTVHTSTKLLPLFKDSANRNAFPLKDPVLALCVARNGHIFGIVTATSITLWQTKVSCFPFPPVWSGSRTHMLKSFTAYRHTCCCRAIRNVHPVLRDQC